MEFIITPTDFSENAYQANKYALSLADYLECDLHIIHSFMVNQIYSEGIPSSIIEISNSITQDLMAVKSKLLKEVSPKYLDDNNIHIISEMGFAAEYIADYANKNKPIAVVMGTHGASGLKKVVMGSVAHKVIKKSNFPTFLIPDGQNGELPQTIMYATNYDEVDEEMIGTVHAMAALLNATIDVVHIGSVSEFENEKDLRRLKSKLESLSPQIDANFSVVEDKTILEGIEYYTSKYEIDLIVLIETRKTLIDTILHPSISKKLIFQSTVPLLVLPRQD